MSARPVPSSGTGLALEKLRGYGEPVLPSGGEVFQGLKRGQKAGRTRVRPGRTTMHCDFRSLHRRNTLSPGWLEGCLT